MVKKDIRTIALDQIKIDNSLNPREGALDQEAVFAYSQHIDELPFMHVFVIGRDYVLTRGFHRFAAHQLAGETKANFEVHSGTWDEAREDADLDNLKHGIQLNRRERRLVIERYLKRHSERSDVWIAKDTYTTDKTVRDVREKLEETSEIPRHDILIDVNGIRRPRTVARPQPQPVGSDVQPGFLEQAEADRQAATLAARRTHEAAGSATPLADAFSDLAEEYEPDEEEERETPQELVEAGLAEDDGPPLLGEIYERDEPGEVAEFEDESDEEQEIGQELVDERRSDIERALSETLYETAGSGERWNARREQGLSDAELELAIAFEFGESGGGSVVSGWEAHRGGKVSRFWFNPTEPSSIIEKPLKGQTLITTVRRLLRIPQPQAQEPHDQPEPASEPESTPAAAAPATPPASLQAGPGQETTEPATAYQSGQPTAPQPEPSKPIIPLTPAPVAQPAPPKPATPPPPPPLPKPALPPLPAPVIAAAPLPLKISVTVLANSNSLLNATEGEKPVITMQSEKAGNVPARVADLIEGYLRAANPEPAQSEAPEAEQPEAEAEAEWLPAN